MRVRNLFGDISAGPDETVDALMAGSGDVMVERIVSHGGRAPAEGAFKQDGTELVVLMQGEARLVALEPEETFDLKAGDWLEIPPKRRHYVAWSSHAPPAVWLAVHLKPA